MPTDDYQRNSIVECVVRGHAHYGVLVDTPSGEPGWIESEYLDDVPVAPSDWPPIDAVVTAVVLGPRTRDGRWRFCARPSCLAEALAAQRDS